MLVTHQRLLDNNVVLTRLIVWKLIFLASLESILKFISGIFNAGPVLNLLCRPLPCIS